MNNTIKEIAKIAGVSIATVSKVLNGRPGFNPSTVIKIKNVAEEQGYFPYCKSRLKGMSRSSQKYIGILTTPGDYTIRAEMDHAIERVFSKLGYNIIKFIFSIKEGKIINLDLFRSNVIENVDVAGLISVTVSLSDKTVAELKDKGIPIVFIDKFVDYGKCVYINNQKAASDAVNRLISLDHEKIGFITPEPSGYGYDVWAERLLGYKKALNKSGLGYDPGLVEYENTFDLEMVKIVTKNLIRKNKGMSAVIFTSDKMAIPGIRTIIESGLKIPDDISVIGFDDMEFDEYIFPKLSSIRQPAHEMGEKAARMLYNAITKKNYRHEAVCLDTELIARESIGKFNKEKG
jgi:LacI family transcriptional regulator